MFDRVTPIFRSQIVAEKIVSKILDSEMQVGDKLAPEREMAKSMDVSRNTLREAIAMLQMAGVLEVRRSSGIYLAALPNVGDVRQWLDEAGFGRFSDSQSAIDARIALEPGVAIMAARSATEDDWEKFDGLVEEMKIAAEQGSVEDYRDSDNRLHKALAFATRNDIIISLVIPVIDTARQPLWNAIKQNIYNADVLRESLSEHQQIIAAMRTQDEYFIFRAFTRHLENSKNRLGLDIVTSS
ncbi:FadR/GntR family transcriptional regulator [Pseudohoeflea coraliihabitans]|uniref:FCD domain-containing protein n=1 Tax=Pseudohoeflea coraliihabitans TaxID=2860393 RepID=A0ABS6WMM4_9HYPH|nr:FCD domain-containing protein [Pseudohoeflea sp. DP4N28-3]MBW3097201.1 FCD domain-containing protein [Pseudohoeflea sp. DP4N28-3]